MSAAENDTDAGKFVIWIAGGVGLAAVVAYGSYQLQRRADARPVVAQPATGAQQRIAVPFEMLAASVVTARKTWDITQLSKVEAELARAEGRTPNDADAQSLRLARAEAMSTRALEAAIRAGTVAGDKLAAKAVADRAVVDGRALLQRIDTATVDRARFGAAQARLALAAGDDVAEAYPVVLMPNYHDPSLRLASLAQPLWRGDVMASADLDELATELRAVKDPNGLARGLLALTLDAQGDSDGALEAADAILSEAPRQPLALGLRAKLTAVASAASVGKAPPAPLAKPSATKDSAPTGPASAFPIEDSAPAEKSAPSPPPSADQPKAGSPKAGKPKAGKPKAGKPKAGKAKAGKAKAKQPRGFDALLAEGCKLAKTGNAGAGFKMLKKAHDLSPGGTKITLCMAQAQAKLGNNDSARAFVDRVLRSSGRHKTALLLAAKLDAKAGNNSSALKLYRRVLEVDAENKTALAFVEKNG